MVVMLSNLCVCFEVCTAFEPIPFFHSANQRADEAERADYERNQGQAIVRSRGLPFSCFFSCF